MLKDLYHYFLIKRSGLFDSIYYLKTYPDVRKEDVNPLWHFIKNGWKEGRNPSKDYNSKYYLTKHKDVYDDGNSPLIHYIKYGIKEERQINEQKIDLIKYNVNNTLPTIDSRYELVYKTYLKNAKSNKDEYYINFKENDRFDNEDLIKLIAFYLPQFHPIPENDRWWGKGFTEWTNVSKAVPQFIGHYQPHLPGELGYYDLRLPDVLRKQVELAKNYGIYGFCFHYYWFNKKKLLEKPLEIFINHPEFDFPFCLCWANENWTRKWDGRDNDILIEQKHTYEYDKNIILDLINLFKQPNYIRIKNRPLFIVYRPELLKEIRKTLDFWREYSIKAGVGIPYILAAQTFNYCDPRSDGFDGAIEFPPHNVEVKPCLNENVDFLNNNFKGQIFSYENLAKAFSSSNLDAPYQFFKTVSPCWDNSPRRIEDGLIFANTSPNVYRIWLEEVCKYTYSNFPKEERIVFINAWNEWAEGAHLEPDRKFGYAFLQKTYEIIAKSNKINQHLISNNHSTQKPPSKNQYKKKYESVISKWPTIGESDIEKLSSINIDLITLALDHMFSTYYNEANSNIDVSIIVPVYNHFKDTLECLKSLAECNENASYEIIIVDDNSLDITQKAFSNCRNIKYIRNPENLGFLKSCNQAAQFAKGNFLVFLNNDTVVLPGWLDALVNTFSDHPQAGLVGSKLVYPNGTLQEAGGVVFRDGSAFNFGRDDDPNKPSVNYLREADYCSAACICVPKTVWMELNGFDTLFSPAYYEDTDFAFRVRDAGYQVLYQPFSEIIHIEGKTSGMDVSKGIKHYQLINQQKFYQRWKSVLNTHGDNLQPPLKYRNRKRQRHVLVIDVCTPKPDQDSGSIDTYHYLLTLRNLGFEVTFISRVDAHIIDKYVVDLQKKGVECIYQPYLKSIEDFIQTNGEYYDLVFLFRAPSGGKYIDKIKKYSPHAKIVFNTVDLHFLREQREKELQSSENAIELKQEGVTKDLEISIMKKADKTILVSDYEYELLKKTTKDIKATVIPLPREIPGRTKGFDERNDIVFIGGFLHKPNVDAVHYFVHEIWPKIINNISDCRFLIVGSNVPEEIQKLENNSIKVLGFVPDLTDVFSNCKLSVAPLRFGAGIKGKVVTSLSYGVPCVATSIAIEGMGLTNLENILISDEPAEFAAKLVKLYAEKSLWEKLSKNGLALVEAQYSLDNFEKNIGNLLKELNIDP